mmetsp:Transcript_11510/g.20807  ORF Transcript_11510/g.20807 Transcript_11510/m.20807 type:complete len:92 (+) Transcript_11510:1896-2171(+)
MDLTNYSTPHADQEMLTKSINQVQKMNYNNKDNCTSTLKPFWSNRPHLFPAAVAEIQPQVGARSETHETRFDWLIIEMMIFDWMKGRVLIG